MNKSFLDLFFCFSFAAALRAMKECCHCRCHSFRLQFNRLAKTLADNSTEIYQNPNYIEKNLPYNKRANFNDDQGHAMGYTGVVPIVANHFRSTFWPTLVVTGQLPPG